MRTDGPPEEKKQKNGICSYCVHQTDKKPRYNTSRNRKEVFTMMNKGLSKKFLGYAALALVCVLAGTLIGTARPAAQAENTVVLTSPFTEAISKVRDSVVGVNNYQIVNSYGNGYGYGYNDPFGGLFPWGYFGYGNGGGYGGGYGNGYGNNQPDTSREVKYGSGSGVVIAKEYVLTNYHVVDGASSLKISVNGDQDNLYDAFVAASDEAKDVAVLYVPGLALEPVELGDSDKLQIGDWAICIGNPIGFTGTVTAGIVSALNREIPGDGTTQDKYGRTTKVVNTMIQTDAAINSGNSGGGMFNTAGQLVGIPTLKYSGTRYSSSASVESIGMCIPINEAKDVIDQALKADMSGKTASAAGTQDLSGKPRMGINVTTFHGNGELPNGVLVNTVDAGSPAEAAGLKPKDIMVEVNGQVITSVSEEVAIVGQLKEGDEVQVKVFRENEDGSDGEYIDLTVKLAMVDKVQQ